MIPCSVCCADFLSCGWFIPCCFYLLFMHVRGYIFEEVSFFNYPSIMLFTWTLSKKRGGTPWMDASPSQGILTRTYEMGDIRDTSSPNCNFKDCRGSRACSRHVCNLWSSWLVESLLSSAVKENLHEFARRWSRE